MTELFNFQHEGSKFLRTHRFCLLADEMGVGKTPQAIDAARNLQKVLVVCPAVAKYNWQKEFLKFDNRLSQVIEGGHTPGSATCITSFDYVRRNLGLFTDRFWDVVIVDEAHYLKEPKANRTQAVLGYQGLIHSTERLWALTGTPAPNHAGELWVWLYTFGYTKLSYEGFIARYCNSYQVGGRYSRVQITGSNTKHTPELKALIKKFSLRRLKKDVLDLPPIFHNQYYIEGDQSDVFRKAPDLKAKLQREFEMLNERIGFGAELPDDDKLLLALQLISQSVSAVRRYHGFLKVRPVADLVRNELYAQEYNKIIIFGIHKDVLDNLERLFNMDRFKVVKVTGATPAKDRVKLQDQFQNDPETRIFIGNIAAAGTNLTLTAANQVLFIEQDWVPGNNKQAADRAHRHGQRDTVSARHVCIKDSIDEKIVGTIARKVREIQTFID